MNETLPPISACGDALSELPLETLEVLLARQTWLSKARPDQLPPNNYFTWLLLAGRGSGKTRSGAEDMWWCGYNNEERIAVVGPTFPDVRKTCFEGESGLLAVIPPSIVKSYNRTSLELWLNNGTYFVGYSSEEPERLRGPQHHRAWCEEMCAWRNMTQTWDMLMFGLRLGDYPRTIITTTPKPGALIREIVKDVDTVVSKSSTFDNAENLPKKFLEKLLEKYEGTRLGRQELYAEILEASENALWNLSMIEGAHKKVELPTMKRVVVSVDPAITAKSDSNETGIIVSSRGDDDRGYVLADASGIYSPGDWAQKAIQLYRNYGADRIVAEGNQGGEMVRHTISTYDSSVPISVVYASRGKYARAEPVAALYEQNRVSHVGVFTELEDQLVTWEPLSGMESPDRLDALVWGLTSLMLQDTVVSQEELLL